MTWLCVLLFSIFATDKHGSKYFLSFHFIIFGRHSLGVFNLVKLLCHHATHGNHLGRHDAPPNGMRNAKTSPCGSSGFTATFLRTIRVGGTAANQTGRARCTPGLFQTSARVKHVSNQATIFVKSWYKFDTANSIQINIDIPSQQVSLFLSRLPQDGSSFFSCFYHMIL